MIETEIKYILENKEAARAVVSAAGVEWIDGAYETNRIFDTPEGRLRREGSVVRLRTRGGTSWLTYKQKTPESDGIAKLRIEHEMEVSSPGSAGEFLSGIGLVERLRYDKYRAEYELLGALLVMDRLPGGWFCEIEGDSAGIARASEACGLSRDQVIEITYPEICSKLFLSNKLLSPCWIFPAAGEAEIVLPEPTDPWWDTPPEIA